MISTQENDPELIYCFRGFNGWPAGSPVNASLRTSRCTTHDSGPVWFAIPFLLETSTLYSLPISRRTSATYQMKQLRCDSVGGVRVSPLKGSGSLIVGFDVTHELAAQVGNGFEDSAGNHVALDFGEPVFDLRRRTPAGQRETANDAARVRARAASLAPVRGGRARGSKRAAQRLRA